MDGIYKIKKDVKEMEKLLYLKKSRWKPDITHMIDWRDTSRRCKISFANNKTKFLAQILT